MKLFKEVDYENSYSHIDGVKAIVMLVLLMAIQFSITLMSIWAINAYVITLCANAMYALCLMLVLFVFLGKEKANTIGITKHKLILSIVLGIVLGAILAVCRIVLGRIPGIPEYYVHSFRVVFLLQNLLIIVTEEIAYRGFIGTRLCGFFKNHIVSSIITAVVFVLYFSLSKVPLMLHGFIPPYMGNMILMAALLHFLTDITYKLTNNIWGAIVAHIIYYTAGILFLLQF